MLTYIGEEGVGRGIYEGARPEGPRDGGRIRPPPARLVAPRESILRGMSSTRSRQGDGPRVSQAKTERGVDFAWVPAEG